MILTSLDEVINYYCGQMLDILCPLNWNTYDDDMLKKSTKKMIMKLLIAAKGAEQDELITTLNDMERE